LNTATHTVEVLRRGQWLALDDPLLAELSFVSRLVLNRKGKLVEVPVGKEKVHDALLGYAHYNEYDPIAAMLENLPAWDERDRIRLLASYIIHRMPMLPDGSEPVETFLRKWLVGAVAKALSGAQNFTLVLIGRQGIGKSSLARQLAPSPDLFTDSPLDPDTRESVVQAARCLIWELNELGSTTRRKDVDALKRFLTAPETSIRLPYARQLTTFRHRASFVATSNDAADLLRDSTGNRRFVVLTIDGIDWKYRVLDILQLWSQAVHLYKHGYDFTLTAEEAGWRDSANARVESVRSTVTAEALLEVLLEARNAMDKSAKSYVTCSIGCPSDDGMGTFKVVVHPNKVILPAMPLYQHLADVTRERPEQVAAAVRKLIGRFADPNTKNCKLESKAVKSFVLTETELDNIIKYITGGESAE
jgi:predicted P-loop ATPase